MLSVKELKKRSASAKKILRDCCLCHRRCGADRLAGKEGFCRCGSLAKVQACLAHRGEEPPVSGTKGSGTVFFTGCTMRCVFCQNYQISQQGLGRAMAAPGLAAAFLRLQREGCHNVNLVSPTQFVPQILEALCLAAEDGFCIPLVYNTNAYDSEETLKLLDGVIDIYLPDFKYASDEMAARYSSAPGYAGRALKSVSEMHRQAGDLACDDAGIARRGLIVRHLVLPDGVSGTDSVLEMLRNKLGAEIYVSLMSQYFPANRSSEFPEIDRKVTQQEYAAALESLERHGMCNGYVQELDDSSDGFKPDFTKNHVFEQCEK